MTEQGYRERQRSLVRRLVTLIHDRARLEVELEETFHQAVKDANANHRVRKARADEEYASDREVADREYAEDREHLKARFEAERSATQRAFDSNRERVVDEFDQRQSAVKKALQEAVWIADTVFETAEPEPRQEFEQICATLEDKKREMQGLIDQASTFLQRYRHRPIEADDASNDEGDGAYLTDVSTSKSAIEHLDEAITTARSQVETLANLSLPRLINSPLPLAAVIIVFVGVVALVNLVLGSTSLLVLGGSAVAATLPLIGLLFWMQRRAQDAVDSAYRPLCESVDRANAAQKTAIKHATTERERKSAEIIQTKQNDLAAAKSKYGPMLDEVKRRHNESLREINEKYPNLLKEIEARREDGLRDAEDTYESRVDEMTRQHDSETRENDETLARLKSEQEEIYRAGWSKLVTDWTHGLSESFDTVEELSTLSASLFPAWDDPSWQTWDPPHTFAPVIRLGEFEVDLEKIEGGLPTDERLVTDHPARFQLPAFLEFPDQCSLLMKTGLEGRTESVATLQTAMLRLLSSLPPGKVRFTIFDPIGLGQNFAGFMHLADYEEASVAGKIWTEPRHIEQRLADLTEHMENVIQKYLRNEFETITDYNEHAGEIAEPYRFLVISDFPVHFSDVAARRLMSIATSGARCGVHLLMNVDTREALPQGIEMAEFEAACTTLTFDEGKFIWNEPILEDLPLTLDTPPEESLLTSMLHKVGAGSKDASRVEVPFNIITPNEDQVWTRTSESEVSVSLGRAGATKQQHLVLGHGTSQHALLAGKTGSGKSTLLHVMIANLGLWYSPDEVQFYLVDFKKGVEFKTYATHKMPHARVVAVESDREFGLSVLQRVDRELKRRGRMFRELGVQDLKGYRRQTGEPLPRTLLIIDEFQEFFVDDDKVAQDAALLLDRLVRQGRAFGIHVMLGSQTLGGAYSLARSTLGQMAIRIALQCSESDSYLILSDDNAAARLLARPGEAIYNDASGLVEGNSPFQIAWLPERTRDEALQQIQARAREAGYKPSEPQIVFEGNVPADIRANQHLHDAFAAGEETAASSRRTTSIPRAWLGEAIAIKDPTAATFERQNGHNVLIVGQRDEAARAMMCTSLISLAAQTPVSHSDNGHGGARFYFLDGDPPESDDPNQIAQVADVLPHRIRVATWRDTDDVIAEIAAEVERRQAAAEYENPPVFLFIYGVQRFRTLRKREDDFGFSFSSSSDDEEAPPRPDKQFQTIYREGPGVGVHVMVWADTMTVVDRVFDRQALREFGTRVLFQMSANDSTTMIDTPVASRLGLHRALFYSEEEGAIEKFRPYAMPDEQWIATLGAPS